MTAAYKQHLQLAEKAGKGKGWKGWKGDGVKGKSTAIDRAKGLQDETNTTHGSPDKALAAA